MYETLLDGYSIDRVWLTYVVSIITLCIIYVIVLVSLAIKKAEGGYLVFLILIVVPLISIVFFHDMTRYDDKECGPSFTTEHIIQETNISEPITVILNFKRCRTRTYYGEEFGPYTTEYVSSTTTIY